SVLPGVRVMSRLPRIWASLSRRSATTSAPSTTSSASTRGARRLSGLENAASS
ncbi:MAG: hypothetical protein AVDCRST_MAG93-8054, partial [uncultured Chloroflexia bacterium]